MDRIRFLTKESLNFISVALGCSFNISPEYGHQHGAAWQTINVLNPEKAYIGKIVYQNGALYNYKCVKKDYQSNIDEIDWIWFRLERFIKDGTLLDRETFGRCLSDAKTLKDDDLAEKLAWREKNPLYDAKGKKRRRKWLQGRNVRMLARDVVLMCQPPIKIKGERVEKVKYRVYFHSNKIAKLDIVKESDHSVWIKDGGIERKNTMTNKHFDTWIEAFNFLLDRERKKVESAESRFKNAVKSLNGVIDMGELLLRICDG